MQVIAEVEQPTPWSVGMVVVPKKTRTILICVNLKPLNGNVQREVHPLPTVDDTLAQLTGAKMFSTLDTNSGFWLVPLEKSSRLLTTSLCFRDATVLIKCSLGYVALLNTFRSKWKRFSQVWKESYAIWTMSLFLASLRRYTISDWKPPWDAFKLQEWLSILPNASSGKLSLIFWVIK